MISAYIAHINRLLRIQNRTVTKKHAGSRQQAALLIPGFFPSLLQADPEVHPRVQRPKLRGPIPGVEMHHSQGDDDPAVCVGRRPQRPPADQPEHGRTGQGPLGQGLLAHAQSNPSQENDAGQYTRPWKVSHTNHILYTTIELCCPSVSP